MKIQVINSKSNNQPFANKKIQLQVKGKDGGYLSVTTDGQGYFTIDDKYNGQQIACTMGGQPQWITASEGGKLNVALDAKSTVTTGGRSGK